MKLPAYSSSVEVFRAELAQFIVLIKNLTAGQERSESGVDDLQAAKWRDKAVPLLTADLQVVESSLLNLSDSATLTKLRNVADREVHLSRNLDEFDFSFAGNENGDLLRGKATKVVIAASNLLNETEYVRGT